MTPSFPPPAPFLSLLVWLYSFIAVCSLVGFLHPKLRRPEGRNVRAAINSWWPSALVGGGMVAVGRPGGVVAFAAVSFWCLREYLRLLPAEDRHPVTDAVAYLTVPLHYGLLAWGSSQGFLLGWLFWAFGVLPLVRAFVIGPGGTLGALPRIQFGLVLTVFALSHVAWIFRAGPDVGPVGAPGLAGLLLLTVMSNDAAQFVFGKLFGRHLLAPRISPKKTWEGFAGGVVTTAVVAALAAQNLTPYSRPLAAALGAALAAVGLLGDLLVSSIKRDAGVKDTGAVLPGQGGLLDRCDSLLLTAPIYAWGVLAWL